MKKLNVFTLVILSLVLSACTLSSPKKNSPQANDNQNTSTTVNENTNQNTNNNPTKVDLINVILDETFILGLGQTAKLASSDYQISINNFINSPCPKGAQCLWSGQGINWQHSFKGENKSGLNLLQAFGYKITLIDTDYQTFAKLKINLLNNIDDLTSCQTDADCVPATCCHPTSAVNQKYAPDCAAVACDMSCQVPLDCGGAKIACQNSKCTIINK